MKALVVLSAVLAASVARPGSLVAVQPPTPDAASSKAPAARANSNLEANVDDATIVRMSRSLKNPVTGTFKPPKPVKPTRSNSFPISDGSDDPTAPRFVDNPHIGLPFGSMLPLREPISHPQVSPTSGTVSGGSDDLTATRFVDNPHIGLPFGSVLPLHEPISHPQVTSTASTVSNGSDDPTATWFVDNPHIGLPFGSVLPLHESISHPQFSPTAGTGGTTTTFKIDAPHMGLPADSGSPDSPAGTTIVSSPLSPFPTGTASDSALGSSLYNNLTSPASVTTNNGDVRFSSLPKSQFSINPGLPDVFIPNNFPTHSTHDFFPVRTPISHVPISARPPVQSDSTSLPMNNGNIDLLISDPFGGFFTKTVSSNFLSKSPSSIFTPTSNQGKFFHSFPVNSPKSNPLTLVPVSTVSFAFTSSSRNTYPLTHNAFTINNPPRSVPIKMPTSDVPVTSPSSNLPANRANVILFSDTVPFGNVVNTPQGPVLVGGPSNFAIFPRQPSLDEVNQVLTAHKAPAAPAPTAAASPGSSNAATHAPGAIFFAGVPVSLGDSQLH